METINENNLIKQLFDSNGALIKEGDIIKVSKLRSSEGFVLMCARYDYLNQRWLFYNDVVPYEWRDLQLSQVKSIVIHERSVS